MTSKDLNCLRSWPMNFLATWSLRRTSRPTSTTPLPKSTLLAPHPWQLYFISNKQATYFRMLKRRPFLNLICFAQRCAQGFIIGVALVFLPYTYLQLLVTRSRRKDGRSERKGRIEMLHIQNIINCQVLVCVSSNFYLHKYDKERIGKREKEKESSISSQSLQSYRFPDKDIPS